jgi:two-component system response regulator NreC
VTARTRVLVADDHTIVRQGLVGILEATKEFEVVGEASTGAETIERALALAPDLVLLDLSMPHLSGLEAARRIRQALPKCRILVLTMHTDEEYVLRMVQTGVSGYIVKDTAASELLSAIRTLMTGRAYFGPHASKALDAAIQAGAPRPADPYGRLTNREREVFTLIVEGHTNGQIAEKLGVSPKTVDNHRTRLMEKLGVHSAAELVRYAAQHGLLS